MTLYAFGLQKVFLVKNIIVGWLGVSPLIGSSLLLMSATTGVNTAAAAGGGTTTTLAFTKLVKLAIIGFAVGIAREILKDMEDVDVDKMTGKVTLPIVVGSKVSHSIAYTFVAIACILCYTPGYRSLFTSTTTSSTASATVATTSLSTSSSVAAARLLSVIKKSIPYYMISTIVDTIMCFKASR